MNSHSHGIVAWLVGRPAAGKSTLAAAVASRLRHAGLDTLWLDGERVRGVSAPDLGFDEPDRALFDARFIELVRGASLRHDFVLVSAAAPTTAYRELARSLLPGYVEVLVTAPAELLERRDPKGLYGRVRRGAIAHVPGIDAPFEEPRTPDLVLDTELRTVDELASELDTFLRGRVPRAR